MWIAQHHSWNEEKVMAMKNGMTKSTSFQNTTSLFHRGRNISCHCNHELEKETSKN